jgi:16S rRNA processing protein RimM
MAKPDLVLMGRASGAFGVKGELKVFPFGRDLGLYTRAGELWLGPNPEAARPRKVVSQRAHGGRVLLTLEGVADRDQAQALGGQWVWVPAQALPPLKEGEYYWHQIKGSLVVTTQGVELGRVKDVTYLGGHDLLLVVAPDGKEALIPVVEGVVVQMDQANARITVDLPPGLLDAQGWPEDEKALEVRPSGAEAD